MNLLKRAMEAVFGKGTSKSAARRRDARERSFDIGTRNSQAVSRQTIRAKLRDEWYATYANKPGTRKERRALARAYASQEWKRMGAK